MDTGPIYRSHEIPCDNGTNGELLEIFAQIGSGEVLRTLSMIEAGEIPQPQSGESSLAPKIGSSELRLSFEMENHLLLRRIRAFSPRPGSWCEFGGNRIKIMDAKPSKTQARRAGEIISLSPLVIGCTRGSLEITKVQEAGKRLMTGIEWARGSRVQVGDCFE
jgi:methionyl-tRNA formyltransferase